ncbi:MAG: RagB/SusD family nutrient uptake outer membrane protein [Bacteroidales bacterium]
MKIFIKTKTGLIATFILLVSVFVSCTDYLDKAPNSDIDPEEAFQNFRNFQGFTEELYNCITLYTASGWHNSWNLGEEEYWEPGQPGILAYQIDEGNYWAWTNAYYNFLSPGGNPSSSARTNKGSLWSLSWYGIRKANIGIDNLELMVDATQEERNLIAGQLYFFRAWFHFELMRFWGGLPYVDRVIPADEVIRIPRMSYQETAEMAAADFQMAADLLPIDWDETQVGKVTLGNNNQRINKIMALAYLGKNLLFAGSPLMNEASGGSATYNEKFCRRAADALGEALELSESTERYELASFEDYSSLFWTRNQNGRLPGLKEAIFYENLAESSSRFRWNQITDYIPMDLYSGGIKCSPTANYVLQNYGMANGLPINQDRDITQADANSGYNPEYPWKDRDPRFYHDIIVDGEKCALNTSGSISEDVQFASLYTGGRYRTANGTKAMLTGLINTKFRHKYTNQWDGYMDYCVVLSLMRLADVYLLYSEATAASYGVTSSSSSYNLTALDAINEVRARAGVGSVDSHYTSSFDLFMSELQRERAVELAFEGHRFDDLRRWKLLDKKPYTLKCSIEFERDPAGLTGEALAENYKEAKVLNLRLETLFEKQYTSKHYWLPFLLDDVNLYVELEQNPGW